MNHARVGEVLGLMNEFKTTRTWAQINFANGERRYDKVWTGYQEIGDTMLTFKNFDDYLLFEVMLWQGKKGKVFNIWVVCQDIDIYY